MFSPTRSDPPGDPPGPPTKPVSLIPSSASVSSPEWLAPLSRELESVIAKRNLFSAKSRSKLLTDLEATARESEDATMARLRQRAVKELLQSERSYLRHLEIVQEFFMKPLEVR